MVGGLKTLVVKAGHESEFEALFAELRNAIRQHEPGCHVYALLKSRTNSRNYIVHEQYRDQAALDSHQVSQHGRFYFRRCAPS